MLNVLFLHSQLQRGVHETTKEFLKRLSAKLQEESVNWGQKHDDDLQMKDRELEVRVECLFDVSVREQSGIDHCCVERIAHEDFQLFYCVCARSS